jgi:hypothetical protein
MVITMPTPACAIFSEVGVLDASTVKPAGSVFVPVKA